MSGPGPRWQKFGERLPHEIRDTLDLDRWLIAGLIPKGLILMAAEPKTGKTMLDTALCLAVAEGVPLCGLLPAAHEGPAIYFTQEDAPPDMALRVRILADGYGEIERLYIATQCSGLRLDNEEHQKMLAEVVAESGAKIIVFDTFRQFFSGDENNSQEVNFVTRFLRNLIAKFDCTVIVNHHLTRATGTPRGSTEWEGAADAIIKMTKVDRDDPEWLRADVTSIVRAVSMPMPWRFEFNRLTGETRSGMRAEHIAWFCRIRDQLGVDSDLLPFIIDGGESAN